MFGFSLIPKQLLLTTSREAMLLLVVFLGLIWTVLVNELRVEWTINPQYGYGWAVPFLCLYLLWGKIDFRSSIQRADWSLKNLSCASYLAAISVLALLLAPTELIAGANPQWRLVSWALALEVVGLTLLLIKVLFGGRWLRRLAFPVAYFLVAVPWPTVLEGPLIQSLTRCDASATVELLGWFGLPAMPHGNVIEVSTGEVGIDEACSGIRSFQASLMISLFLGELYQLNLSRRLILILSGFVLSFGFNVARMCVLVWVAAHHGIAAIAKWHDPTGVTILLACFLALWGLGALLARKKNLKQTFLTPTKDLEIFHTAKHARSLLIALLSWFVLVEISMEAWYRWHELKLAPAAHWTIEWPTDNPTFKTIQLPESTRQILRYDEGQNHSWSADGVSWQAVFLHWKPGRTAVHLAQNHTPEVCMTGAGHSLKTIATRKIFAVSGLEIPFIVYALNDTPKPMYIFYCLWDDRGSQQGRDTLFLNYGNRLIPVWQGLRNPGQRSLEVAVTGSLNETQAEAAFQNQLQKIITYVPTSLGSGLK